MRTEKFCPDCRQTLPVERFQKNKRRGGLQAQCGECLNKRRKANYLKQKGRGGAPLRKTKTHPRVTRALRSTSGGRARKAGTRTIRLRARDPVAVDPQALRDAWPADGLCAISGLALLTEGRHHRHPHYAEPDRIDPDYGYVPGNVQWVRKCYNEWKSDAPLEVLALLGQWAQRQLDERKMD
ncbi:MAG: hypothetical protein K0S14_232 [Thermomicrobiales bacterium]|jgi:hypothetical protein|nr:hypothetical protein [Thermomicrobiales bacterium]